jgi:hypothetical protein
MNPTVPANAPPNANPPTPHPEADAIPVYDRLVLWMFLFGFVTFGLILVGDLIVAFFR